MAGHSRPKDGVASLAFVPAIHALEPSEGVDARHKAGHDVERLVLTNRKMRERPAMTNGQISPIALTDF
jgi:hypothetical protein